MNIKNIISSVLKYFPWLNQKIRLYMHKKRTTPLLLNKLEEKQRHILSHVNQYGYYILEDYFSAEWCDTCKAQVKKVINADHDFIHVAEDKRLFGVENISKEFSQFYSDTFLNDLANAYYQCPSKPLVTLANWIVNEDTNKLGSGGDWHRDNEFRQIKAIVYLNDVEIENGPFQMIVSSVSDNFNTFEKDTKILKNPELSNRYTQEQVNCLLEKFPERSKVFTAKKGTVILADTSAIHRGSPIQSGERFAVFNYYYPDTEENRAFAKKKFAPLVPEGFLIRDQ